MAINTEKTQAGQGFQPSKTSNQSSGVSEAITLAKGLESTLAAQASSLGELAQKTDLAAEAIAAPIVDFIQGVTNGDLLMSKIAAGLEGQRGQGLQGGDIKVNPVTMPKLSSAKMSDNFFAKPKQITGV